MRTVIAIVSGIIGILVLVAWAVAHLDSKSVDTSAVMVGNKVSQIIELPNGAAMAVLPGSVGEQLAKYLASDLPPPRSFRVGDQEFAEWSGTSTAATRGTVAELVLLFNAYPKARFRIAGFTDTDGSLSVNMALSETRARSVMRQLIAEGVREDRISAIGYGFQTPVASNATKTGQAQNRRIEIEVVEK